MRGTSCPAPATVPKVKHHQRAENKTDCEFKSRIFHNYLYFTMVRKPFFLKVWWPGGEKLPTLYFCRLLIAMLQAVVEFPEWMQLGVCGRYRYFSAPIHRCSFPTVRSGAVRFKITGEEAALCYTSQQVLPMIHAHWQGKRLYWCNRRRNGVKIAVGCDYSGNFHKTKTTVEIAFRSGYCETMGSTDTTKTTL